MQRGAIPLSTERRRGGDGWRERKLCRAVVVERRDRGARKRLADTARRIAERERRELRWSEFLEPSSVFVRVVHANDRSLREPIRRAMGGVELPVKRWMPSLLSKSVCGTAGGTFG